MKNQRGFTLIEIMLVIIIGVVLGGIVVWGIAKQNHRQDIDLTATAIVATLREAAERSRSQSGGAGWGVYFKNPSSGSGDYYALFSGSTFITGSTTNPLPASVQFTDPADGESKEVIFSRLIGLPNAAVTITLKLVNDPATTRTITVQANGAIAF